VLCLLETVVGAGLGFEQPAPCGLKCAIDGDAADLVRRAREVTLSFSCVYAVQMAWRWCGVRRVFLCMFMSVFS